MLPPIDILLMECIAGPLAQLIYFYLPLAVILTANLLLFIITLKKIFAMQSKTPELNSQDSKKYVGNSEVSSKSLR